MTKPIIVNQVCMVTTHSSTESQFFFSNYKFQNTYSLSTYSANSVPQLLNCILYWMKMKLAQSVKFIIIVHYQVSSRAYRPTKGTCRGNRGHASSIHTVCTNGKMLAVMHLSIVCPTHPSWGKVGIGWGFDHRYYSTAVDMKQIRIL